ncbi:hypothetical protein [Roseobacter sinensis]|uniref:Uncharacterized protein n=1 Tax=Roseobacter sinensis TaxID=2931391 RepID=A0ABT3BG77_9RHOB|nr:hypothetical protein [Roseobacter sp. WL0113]MCV3272568.1 hypothetical protein [Roseobacter sp. WL0113]
MPSLSLYIPFGRSHGLFFRLVARLIARPRRGRANLRGQAHLPSYLRKDVGLLPEIERPPPELHRFPF